MDTISARLYERYPQLTVVRDQVEAAGALLIGCYEEKGKVLACGNGGSAADAEHIVGELMKGFLLPRPLPPEERAVLEARGERGAWLARHLQGALPAIALTGAPALSTAFMNDVKPELAFAQQVYGYGRQGDVLVGLSTSGEAENVCYAAEAALARGLSVIGITGERGGALRALSTVWIGLPATETFAVQELTLPVYHALCAQVEHHFFGR